MIAKEKGKEEDICELPVCLLELDCCFPGLRDHCPMKGRYKGDFERVKDQFYSYIVVGWGYVRHITPEGKLLSPRYVVPVKTAEEYEQYDKGKLSPITLIVRYGVYEYDYVEG